ncbi:MAG: catalase HPII, partial [Maribacter dokdonensis]
ENGKYIKFINETFKYCKAIAADKEGENVLDHTFVANFKEDGAVHINDSTDKFIKSIAKHRNWDRREHSDKVPV